MDDIKTSHTWTEEDIHDLFHGDFIIPTYSYLRRLYKLYSYTPAIVTLSYSSHTIYSNLYIHPGFTTPSSQSRR